MIDRKLYRQKRQAQFDERRAEVDKLKARTSGFSADTQLEMKKQIKALERNIEEGKTKLTQLSEASDDAWGSIRDGVESAWDSSRYAVSDAAAKFKK